MKIQINGRECVLDIIPLHSFGAEIGVHVGDFSARIVHSCSPKKLLLIDPWQYNDGDKFNKSLYGGKNCNQEILNTRYENVRKRFSKQINQGIVEIVRKNSQYAAHDIVDNSLDFVYVDGDHSYDGVLTDLQVFYKKLKINGLLIGDDYSLDGW